MASPFAQFDSLRTLLAPRAPGDHGVRPGVVLGITLLLSFLLGPAIVERLRWSKVSQGLLVRDVRVAESPDDARQCRSDTCSFEAAAPVPAPPATVRMRFEPPPVRRYPVPAQFTYRYSGPAYGPDDWVAVDHGEPHLPPKWSVRFTSSARHGQRFDTVAVDGPGVMTRMIPFDASEPAIRLADVMQRARLRAERAQGGYDRTADDAQEPSPRLEWFEFQPLPQQLQFRLDGGNTAGLGPGDRVVLRMGTRSDDREHAPAGRIERVAQDDTGVTRVTVRMGDDDRMWIRGWLNVATRTGAPPVPTAVTLDVTRQLGHSSGVAVQVPASAVVERAGQTLVWTVFEGFAVPVQVRVGPVADGWAVVGEIEHAATGGVHRDDWVRLSPWQRKRLLKARPLNGGNTLLSERARVIARPGPALTPGMPVRAL